MYTPFDAWTFYSTVFHLTPIALTGQTYCNRPRRIALPAAMPSAQEAARADDDVAADSGGGEGGEGGSSWEVSSALSGDGDCDATFDTAEGHPRAAVSQHHVDFSVDHSSFVWQSKVVALPPSMRHLM